jgi:protein ImuB
MSATCGRSSRESSKGRTWGSGSSACGCARGALAALPHQQAGHWTPDPGPDDAAIARLVDTLNARLGVGSVRELRPRESHIPEAAFVMDPVVELRGFAPASELPRIDRPSLLYDVPRRVDITFLSPDGPIALVRYAGQSHRVTCGLGPERIEPEWWRHHAFHDAASHDARDYFKIKIEDGRVLWVFRAGGAWFLHGLWA